MNGVQQNSGNSKIYKNFRAIYKKYEFVPPSPSKTDGRHPIFGNISQAKNDPDKDFDERYYEQSILKYSPYFEHRRKIRKTVKNLFETGVLPKRQHEEYPLNQQFAESHESAIIEITDEYKLIKLDYGVAVYIYNDGYIMYYDMKCTPSAITLNPDCFVGAADSRFADYRYGISPKTKQTDYSVKLLDFRDEVTPEGGVLRMSAEISSGGIVTSEFSVEIKLVKMQDYIAEYLESKE